MKRYLVAIMCAPIALASAQTATPGSGASTPSVLVLNLWQDTMVRILGNVAHGPALLDPLLHVSAIPEDYRRRAFWGPRGYASTGRFLNFSFRGVVSQSTPVVLAGFSVSTGGRVMMIRAVGPTLATFGLQGVLMRPRLELFDSAGAGIGAAVPWSTTSADTQSELRSAATSVGAFALNEGSTDQVLLVSLPAGSYSCALSAYDDAVGTFLLEVYEVPSSDTIIGDLPRSPIFPSGSQSNPKRMANQSPQRNAGAGPAISDEASPSQPASSSEKTAGAQPPRG